MNPDIKFDDTKFDKRERGSGSETVAGDIADRAFSRAAGAPLVKGNDVRLLKDAAGNYPAWLDAIAKAEKYIHFESYIIHEDTTGRMFADALIAKSGEGVRVRVIYDWMGGFGKTSRKFWNNLRAGGVEVRVYNPPHLNSPLGWLSRDHRKSLVVDGSIAFVAGLCVGDDWTGKPEEGKEPWRDTGVSIEGPAVAGVAGAFADVWATMGDALPAEDAPPAEEDLPEMGDTALRVVAATPGSASVFRSGQIVAALARQRFWLTDAYFAGTTAYIQALRAAAEDGVDVRLLVPGSSDIGVMQAISRASYRSLLEAGVRVFEWNGTMIHAKTAVVDDFYTRIGSTNLNIASWLGNREIDVFIEDERFAAEAARMYEEDLQNATEIVLDATDNVRETGGSAPRRKNSGRKSSSGSSNRAVAGAISIGSAVGAAITNRRSLGSAESRIMLAAGAILLVFVVLMYFFPRVFLYPFTVFVLWVAVALLVKGFKMRRRAIRTGAKSNRTVSGVQMQSASSIQTKDTVRPNQIGTIESEPDEAVLPDFTTEKEAKRKVNL